MQNANFQALGILTISIANAYALVFAVLFLLQKYTIGLIPGFEDFTVFGLFYLQDLIFIVTSILFILLFIRADVPTRIFSVRRIKRS